MQEPLLELPLNPDENKKLAEVILTKEQLLQKTLRKKMIQSKLFQMSKPERLYFVFGVVSSFLIGSIYPLFSVFFAKMITIMSDPVSTNYDSNSRFYCLMFLVIGFAALLLSVFQRYMFAIVGH